MLAINVPRNEREAIKRVDDGQLRAALDQCLRDGRTHALRDLRLEECGAYVSSKLRSYSKALVDHAAAKSSKKVESTLYDVHVASSDLMDAVAAIKHRVEAEEREDQLFHVDDHLSPPILPSEHLSVRISYRWRRTPADDWVYGSITFLHDVDMRPDYTVQQPRRKPSAFKLADARREKLYRQWEYLADLGLQAVKEFFRDGGDGRTIPQTFRARPAHSGGLNNHSAEFWQEKPRS